MKNFIFFLYTVMFVGCGLFDGPSCESEGRTNASGNYDFNIPLEETYYSFDRSHIRNVWILKKGQYKGDPNDSLYKEYIETKQTLLLKEDSSFLLLKTWVHPSDDSLKTIFDTLEFQKGKFTIRDVPAKKWSSLVLNADSGFSKSIDTTGGIISLSEPSEFKNFLPPADSIILNVDFRDSCFSLAFWHQDSEVYATDDDDLLTCSYTEKSRTFCANHIYRDSLTTGVITEKLKW